MAAPGGSSAWTDVLGALIPPFTVPILLIAAVVGAAAERYCKPPVILSRRRDLQAYLADRARTNPPMAAFYAQREARGWGSSR